MANIFLTADLHFGHVGVTRFLKEDGTKLRPWDSYEDMDEALIANWNKVVSNKDKIYVLGDVVINRRAFPTLARLNGEKILIKGNHDVFRIEEYLPYFKDIRGFGELNGFCLTHVPIHPDSLGRWKGNLHGHTHDRQVMRYCGEDWSGDDVYTIDKRYMCVCVEQTNFTPISLDEANKRFMEQQEN